MGLGKAVRMLHKTEALEKLQSTGMGSEGLGWGVPAAPHLPSLTAPGACFAELKEDSAYGSESVEDEQVPVLALKPGPAGDLPHSQQPQVH